MNREGHLYRRHRRFHHRHRGHGLHLDLHPDVVRQHHRRNLGLHLLLLRRRNLGVIQRTLRPPDDRHRLDRLGDRDRRHQLGDLGHQRRQDEKDHQRLPDGPDLDGPCPVMVRTDCYPDVKLGEEYPCPVPRRKGCFLGEECRVPNLVQHRVLAFQPQER